MPHKWNRNHWDYGNFKVFLPLNLAFRPYISCDPGQVVIQINLELNKLTVINTSEMLYILHELFSVAFNSNKL